jgi:hypothetical protein
VKQLVLSTSYFDLSLALLIEVVTELAAVLHLWDDF